MGLPKSIVDIAEERQRQKDVEGWTEEHDDTHDRGEMARAASCYCMNSHWHWPWDKSWWKPGTDRRRQLVKAGALIAAEIDRLDRKERTSP